MATISSIVLEGIITEDGDLEVQTPLSLPPGPVRITLESIKQGERLPDPPWLDESISAPFDLPRSGKVKYVTPKYEKRISPSPIVVEHMAQHFSTTYSRIALPTPYETE